MKSEFKFRLELNKWYKSLVVFICFFVLILSVYVFFNPIYVQENPKLIYLCPIMFFLSIIGVLSLFRYRIYVYTLLIEHCNIFRDRKIYFNEIDKLVLSSFKTLRIIGNNDTKIELTKDLTNQKDAIRYIIMEVTNNHNIEILNPEFLSDWFNEEELSKLGNGTDW